MSVDDIDTLADGHVGELPECRRRRIDHVRSPVQRQYDEVSTVITKPADQRGNRVDDFTGRTDRSVIDAGLRRAGRERRFVIGKRDHTNAAPWHLDDGGLHRLGNRPSGAGMNDGRAVEVVQRVEQARRLEVEDVVVGEADVPNACDPEQLDDVPIGTEMKHFVRALPRLLV